jgi:glycosyltransferase involved in cell wall biosynthesis
MSRPEIALLLSTYQRPNHLRRALQSIALQQDVPDKIELVVTDDGSTDETPRIVEDFARSAPFRVEFTTHPHTTFRLSRCRNEGVRASRAPYLLFLDGDCVLPPDHVRRHLERREPRHVMAGDFCRLDEATSRRVTAEVIRTGDYQSWAPASELRRLRKQDRAARFYRLIRHPRKPKLFGNNVGIWRSDFESINGYDEAFEGWGCEDDDLRFRLHAAGVQIKSILRWTHTYHLWHPIDATAPATWKQGANVNYLLRRGRLTRCRNGLAKRGISDLAIDIVGRTSKPYEVARLVQGRFGSSQSPTPEVEILFLPGQGRFSGRAQYNLLVALEPQDVGPRLQRNAHLTIMPGAGGPSGSAFEVSPAQFEQALADVA